jgi:hypothetical protein
MRIMYRLISFTLALALVAAALSACGGGTSTGNRPETRDKSVASSSSTAQACLSATDVSRAIDLEVRELRAGTKTDGPNVVCAYQGTDDKLGVSVTTVVGQAERADEVFGKMKQSARLFLGAGAEPEAIKLGERGFAYGGGSKSEAAAVSDGRLYHAEVVSSASADIGDKKAALIEIVRKLMGR